VTAPEVLDVARTLLHRADPATAGLWPRAAALLGRQALEASLDQFWKQKKIALDECATLPQLICLREYLPDAHLAGRIHHAWGALSRACHHHPYELAPTVGEIGLWLDSVATFMERLDA
jgi:hypothetical protein